MLQHFRLWLEVFFVWVWGTILVGNDEQEPFHSYGSSKLMSLG
ncbi:hypothetical protein LOT_1021 [Lentilactobacillus otakiensis DSM 19908 = JCM 15040]|uniref:Uncharacterized protein n=1 Tax=Lentilactobacillus otakiensis DSM 19908 = JCM 15040 TaxID=1423780 RepID=S4NR64_9LACO|nr:hypothetical protein LOT_1021 [Lentilactobacillus otakiensis DSM 19908 = JCM 15040]